MMMNDAYSFLCESSPARVCRAGTGWIALNRMDKEQSE